MNLRRFPATILCTLLAAAVICGLEAQEQASISVWDGVYTNPQATRGQALYHEECARCHGDDLTGEDEAPPLTGGAFLANWDGLTVGDLFERIRLSMPADQPGKLSRERIADILAYVLSANQFPAGQAELDRRTEVLKLIRFEASKPDAKKR